MHDLAKNILKDGIVKLGGFLSKNQVSSLKEEILDKIKKYAEEGYQFGKSLNFAPVDKMVHSETEIYKIFNTDFVKDLTQEYLGDNYLHAVQATHDYIANKDLARNGFLHFDRFHTLKFFVYLTDCDEKCGPFSCIKGTRHLGAQLRGRSWDQSGNYDKVKNRIEIDYPYLNITKKQAKPMIGSAGDLLIFDSDVFHYGGIITEGSERVVLRLHYMKNS